MNKHGKVQKLFMLPPGVRLSCFIKNFRKWEVGDTRSIFQSSTRKTLYAGFLKIALYA